MICRICQVCGTAIPATDTICPECLQPFGRARVQSDSNTVNSSGSHASLRRAALPEERPVFRTHQPDRHRLILLSVLCIGLLLVTVAAYVNALNEQHATDRAHLLQIQKELNRDLASHKASTTHAQASAVFAEIVDFKDAAPKPPDPEKEAAAKCISSGMEQSRFYAIEKALVAELKGTLSKVSAVNYLSTLADLATTSTEPIEQVENAGLLVLRRKHFDVSRATKPLNTLRLIDQRFGNQNLYPLASQAAQGHNYNATMTSIQVSFPALTQNSVEAQRYSDMLSEALTDCSQ